MVRFDSTQNASPSQKEAKHLAGKCDICGKGPQFGHNVSHSKRRTNRAWQPNTHTTRMMVGGQLKRVSVCTRCLRTQLRKASA